MHPYTPQEKESHLLLTFILTVLTVFSPLSAKIMVPDVKLTPLTDDGKSVAVAWAPHGDLICFVREISRTQKQLMIMKV